MRRTDKTPRKEHVISARISSDELQLLEMKARNANKSISDLMREALHIIAPPQSSYSNSSYDREGRYL